MPTDDVEAVRIRARPRLRPLILAVLFVVAAVGARRLHAYEAVPVPSTPRYETMPDSCTVSRTCTFSRLIRAPSARRLQRALALPRLGEPVRLGREWDGIVDPEDRAFLADVLRAPRMVWADTDPSTSPVSERYDALLGIAWAAEVDRERARIADRNSAARMAYVSAVAWQQNQQRIALLPTALELVVLLATLAAAVGFAVHRRQTVAVEVDRNGVRILGRATEWRDVDAIDWYDGSVELRRVDGGVARYDGLDLRAATVDAIEAATARFGALARGDDEVSQRLAEAWVGDDTTDGDPPFVRDDAEAVSDDDVPPWLRSAVRRSRRSAGIAG